MTYLRAFVRVHLSKEGDFPISTGLAGESWDFTSQLLQVNLYHTNTMTLSSKRHFFQALLPGFEDDVVGFEDDVLIPISFCKYLNVQECEKAMLRSQKGEKLWPVKINGRRFEDGWKQFVKDHDLKIGDFLVFRHHGDLVFNVLVLDSTTCEKEYPPVTGKQVETSSCEKEYLPTTAIKEEQIEIEEQNLPKDSTRGIVQFFLLI
ncbi:B3 domain-containing protein REM9-like [Euphorbia lathyris]|uniref:B3 domain-containing protein REM9-like n=1 Tax=Euphorbia lathyris TaxID=212925 RepID=UPI0033143DC2